LAGKIKRSRAAQRFFFRSLLDLGKAHRRRTPAFTPKGVFENFSMTSTIENHSSPAGRGFARLLDNNLGKGQYQKYRL
jgi:hypothetical protein